MKNLAIAALAALGLSITFSNAHAQDGRPPMRISDIVTVAPTQPAPRPAAVSQNGVPAGWDYDPNVPFTTLECERARGVWAPSRNGRILVCWLPRNGGGQLVTPYSPSVQPVRTVRYDVQDVMIPQGLPASMCSYADHGRGCTSGETYYLDLVAEFGTGARAYARFRDDVEAMYRACGRLDVRLEEPDERDEVRRSYGFRYSGGGGGYRVNQRYERRSEEEILTPDQIMYRQLTVLRGEGAAVCEVFRQQYQDTNGFRTVRFI
jgi:hypothetical protein